MFSGIRSSILNQLYVLTIEFSKDRRLSFVRLYVNFSRPLCLLRVFISGGMELPVTKLKGDYYQMSDKFAFEFETYILCIVTFFHFTHSVVSRSVF